MKTTSNKGKDYYYDTKMIVVKTKTREKIKNIAMKEMMTMQDVVEQAINKYGN